MILEYVEKYGKTSFEEMPLNYVDLVVVTAICYFDFPPECFGKSLPDSMDKVVHFLAPDPDEPRAQLLKLESAHDYALRDLIADSPRYAGFNVFDFKDEYQEASHQFGALALMLDDILVVIYRGTDESITGWDEALKLSEDAPVEGQLLARAFLEEQAAKTEGPIIICGHSKGGNEAIYAAAAGAQDPDIAARIALIVNCDGPNLSERMREKTAYSAIEDRICSFVPKSSVIGSVHEQGQDSVEYIDAQKFMIKQHFLFNWKVMDADFVAHNRSLVGKLGSSALNLLVESLDDEQKARVINSLMYLPKQKAQGAQGAQE